MVPSTTLGNTKDWVHHAIVQCFAFYKMEHYLLVKSLILSLDEPPPLALIEKFSLMKDGILEDITLSEEIQLETNILNNIYFRVKKLSLEKELMVIPISSILSKCILIPVKGVEWNYIVKQD